MSQEILELFKQEVTMAGQSFGLSMTAATRLADEIEKKLMSITASCGLNLPKNEKLLRNQAIKSDFNGVNHHDLCKKYNVSLSTLYRILKN